MINYNFHRTLLLRAPVYSYQLYSEENLPAILKHPFFQKAIYFSSEVFYNELQKANFELNKLDKKAIETLKKYFNRMCFRPTPFGISSAFGPVSWGKNGSVIKFRNSNLQPHIQLSFAKSIEYANTLLHLHQQQFVYTLNHSFYKTGNEYRYFKPNHDNAQTEFIIDSIKSDRFLEKMLQYLACGHTRPEIAAFVCLQAGCTTQEADTYIQWLIDSQVINHALEANISGNNYLERLLASDTKNLHPNYKLINKVFCKTIQVNHIDDLQDIPGTEGDLKSADLYVNMEAKFPEGELDPAYQQDIMDGLKCLDYLSTQQMPVGLTDFTKSFTQKFESETIPLLMAIDPEIGVGYGNLAVEEDDINIVKNIMGAGPPPSKTMLWSDVHTLLFNKWKTAPGESNIITLTDEDLTELKKDKETYPPGISVMFRVLNDKVLIESAGGACASALLGRFTPFNADVRQLACDMAVKEAQYNPDIIFAEIAHICHDKTANIDRRAHIYPYEIPVLVQSTVKPEQQVLLDDLWVSVVEGQVILQSKKHGKRVIPRLSSAFNYTRNDLAVFRFLCDLQKAGIKTDFACNLSQLFPGLSFYPRVEYKNTILHLAYWNIKKDTFAHILKASVERKLALFMASKSQLGLPKYVALTQHDHQLVFNLEHEPDVLFFLDTIKTLQQFTVKEYLLPAADIVAGAGNKPHVNQFIASLYHTEQVYKSLTMPIVHAKHTYRKFIPGSEWLYLKLYCHPVRSNELLNDGIGAILKKLNKGKLISQWFFIRYVDPGYHIRLRLKVDPQKQQAVLAVLQQSIQGYIDNATISNYTIATYEREIERYSHEFMDEFEYAFYASSNFVLAFLKQHHASVSGTEVLEFAIASVNDILVSLGLEGKALTGFLDRVFTSFASEFSAISDLKYQLDLEFRKQKTVIELVRQCDAGYYNDHKLSKARTLFINALTNLKKNVASKTNWKEKWVTDLIHMHLNRLFTNDARKQEMAVYYFLLKYERSAQARLNTHNVVATP